MRRKRRKFAKLDVERLDTSIPLCAEHVFSELKEFQFGRSSNVVASVCDVCTKVIYKDELIQWRKERGMIHNSIPKKLPELSSYLDLFHF